ncbi:MAG: TolC family protein [Bacteroides sp.]|nr:TolC family protein [Barnesiella sp.]MBD5323779.1 TolC family protein [Bacteroides sp.]MBD5374239.1 TolC family protein [Bacteroides sp.]MDE7460736.1 TolC family protein [Paramuribaculum sp.]
MKRIYSLAIFLIASAIAVTAQRQVRLDLSRTIEIASDSSLQAFRNQNLFLSGYWEYRSFRAGRLPSLSLDLTPVSYNRYITQRYNYEENIDVYRAQQMYSARGGLNISQNFDPLGGTFYVETSLSYMRNFGEVKSTQFSSIPFRVGYTQSLLGFNSFKWERRIEPIKFEKVKKEFLYNMEQVSETAVSYFFALALAQAEYRLAKDQLASADTLYTIGERRFKIAAISQADLLTLRLDRVNARNSLENTRIALKRAMFTLASFLGMEKDTEIEVTLPSAPMAREIDATRALSFARENNPTLLQHRQNILEAQRDVNRTKVEQRFNANLNASIGFNQVADHLRGAYSHPLRQDLVSLTISIPLIDWGVRKGKLNMAKNNLSVVEIAARQDELSIEEDVLMTVSDFNIQQQLVASALEALDLADAAYHQTRQRFIIGKADINSLTLSLNRQQDANKNYISSLQNYWLSYFKLRRLTLFDFETGTTLSTRFDIAHHI